ncbi:MAG: glycosyltransferase [Bacteroidia bacterium]|nr:glycosyltransferase [Bacteroidia bacterium]
MKFSVAIIGKNERDYILQCINSVQKADEILYMDTGSTDDTFEELKKYKGDNLKILSPYQWRDDFSHARNACTQQAKNDWILTIDCDETLEGQNAVPEIEKILEENANHPWFNGIRINVILPTETCFQLRVHKKSNKWYRPAHNRLTEIQGFVDSNINITARVSTSRKNDPDLRMRIISKYLNNVNNTDPDMWYYLGREFMNHVNMYEAVDCYSKVRRFTYGRYTDLYLDALYMEAVCYYTMNKLDEARKLLGEIISLNPGFYRAMELLARITPEFTKILPIIKENNVLIKRKAVNIMDKRMINRRVAQMATIPDREKDLKKVVQSIIPYVDELRIMLNKYKTIPTWLKNIKNVTPILRNNEKGDAEKFYKVEELKDTVIYILDDDLIYNEVFFNQCHDNTIRLGTPVGYHGKIMGDNVNNYAKDFKVAYSCLLDVIGYHYVNVIGTGCLCFTLEDVSIRYDDFKSENVADLWFSSFCRDRNINLMVLPHVALGYTHPKRTIWNIKTQKDEVTQLYKKLFEEKK